MWRGNQVDTLRVLFLPKPFGKEKPVQGTNILLSAMPVFTWLFFLEIANLLGKIKHWNWSSSDCIKETREINDFSH